MFLMLLSANALSQTLDSLQNIQEAVVTADRTGEKIIPAQVLAGKELEKLGALSVADAVRYFSGVQIKDYGGIGGLKTINVRSMGSQHVGVFFDGIQLGNAQNGQIDLGKFSLDNMESVTLYNGQKSSMVQSAKDYASASAVYMRTRTPQFEAGNRRNVKFSLSGGSFLTVNPSVLWEEKLGKNLSNSFSAEYLYTTGRYKFFYTKADGYDTTAVRHNGDVRALRVEDGLFGNIRDGHWRVKLYFYDSERGYPGAFVREEPGKFKHEDRQWDTDFFVQGSFFKDFSWYRLSVNGKYAYDYLHYLSDPRLDVTTMYVDNHYRQQEAYFSAAQEFKIFKWWDVDLAADYQFNTLDADLIDFVYPSRHTLLTALSTSFRFGTVNFQGSLLYTFVDDNTRKPGAAADEKNILTPTAVLQYKPFSAIDFSLRAFYKKIFRMPTLNDLYYTFIGNKYLNPEYTTQYNVGLTYTKQLRHSFFRGVDLSTDFYFNQVKDKIIAMPTSNQFQWTMVNLGYVEIRGVDVAASFGMKFFDEVGMDLRLTYTYQKAQDFTNPESNNYGGQIPYIPWHSGSAILGVTYRGWSFNYSFIYTGERYESVANIPENYALPWYTSDLSLTSRFPVRSHELAATLELNNIFNQQYEVVQCYPMPGINFRIKLSFTL